LAETPAEVDIRGEIAAKSDRADFGGVGDGDCEKKKKKKYKVS
jgi:hypothetical protein